MNTWFALPPASHGRSPSWQSAFPCVHVCPPIATGEPRPVAVVAIGVPLRPRLPTVGRREECVVDEVDTRVVDASARVLGQVGIAEPSVDRRARGTLRAEIPV